MPPSSPSDLFWNALSPLVQQIEALGHVLEVCATYYSWCAGCAAGQAFLLLDGLVLAESMDDRGGPTERERSTQATNKAWTFTLMGHVAPSIRHLFDEHLGRPSETTNAMSSGE